MNMKIKNVALVVLLVIAVTMIVVWLYQRHSVYQKAVGVDPATGHTLIEKYYCSDLCPENGGTYIVFEGVNSREECTNIGGTLFIDPAWGGYIGCGPK